LPIDKDELAALPALDRLRAIDAAHGAGALLLTSLQKPACVLMHMAHRLGAKVTIGFVDTGLHFPETLELVRAYEERFGLTVERYVPELSPADQETRFGLKLYNYVDGQPLCCEMRKEEPFLAAARGKTATLNGLMRVEGGARGGLGPVGFDPRLGVPTYHPLFDWTFEDVDAYTAEHDLPVHALYAQDYLSIGCAPCTTPVLPGEDRRAGRWRHLRTVDGQKPVYCNINYSDGGGI
jgi:phosphoadenosine phosphosulfate reductase